MPKITNLQDLSVMQDWDDIVECSWHSKLLAQMWMHAKVGSWHYCSERAWHVVKHWDIGSPGVPAFMRRGMDGPELWCLLDVSHVVVA